ncbi:MAG: OpgC domain-containing protein, partial [Candidatus Angelobacter sp.]
THHQLIKTALPIPFPWHHYIYKSLVMTFTYGWADFLVRFAILMLIAPFVFLLIAKGRWWLALIAIFTAWLFRGQSFTLAWQFIFNLGMVIGFYWQEIETGFRRLAPSRRRDLKRTVGGLALLTFAFSYASVFVLSLLFYIWGIGHLPTGWQHVAFTWGWINHDVWNWADKWTMGPLRVLLFFLWFPTLYWIVRKYESQLAHWSAGILELLGRNSLFVYALHSVIIFTFKMYLIPSQTAFWQNFLITIFGLVLLVSITKLYKMVQPSLPSLSLPRLNMRSESAKS